jgi:hypothetical protein
VSHPLSDHVAGSRTQASKMRLLQHVFSSVGVIEEEKLWKHSIGGYICTKCWHNTCSSSTKCLSKKHFHIPNTKGALQRWMNATRMQQELIVLCCTRHALLASAGALCTCKLTFLRLVLFSIASAFLSLRLRSAIARGHRLPLVSSLYASPGPLRVYHVFGYILMTILMISANPMQRS